MYKTSQNCATFFYHIGIYGRKGCTKDRTHSVNPSRKSEIVILFQNKVVNIKIKTLLNKQRIIVNTLTSGKELTRLYGRT